MEILKAVLILGLVALVIGGILSNYFSGHHKADVDIVFTKECFSFGEPISGTFECEFKKAVECEGIIVTLYRVDRTRSAEGRTKIERYEQDETKIKVNKGMLPGSSLRHSFRLKTPSQAGQIVDGVAHVVDRLFFDGDYVNHSWQVAVRIEVNGIDVEHTRSVSVI